MIEVAVCLLLLVVASAACVLHIVPALIGSIRGRTHKSASENPTTSSLRFAVLIPAHNEEQALPHALASLARQTYPAELVDVLVIADNCTDRTAEVASDAAATCFTRTDRDHTGKGHALAFGLQTPAVASADVVLILDADCELNPEALRELAETFDSGTEAVQCAVHSRNADQGVAGFVAAVGSSYDHFVAAGHARLGYSVPLRGTGMAFRNSLLARLPWNAFGPVEDAEYAARLRSAGICVRFCASAKVACDAPMNFAELSRQRRRWRTAATFLGSKPLVLTQLGLTLLVSIITGAFVPWAIALVAATLLLYGRAIIEVGLSWRRLLLCLRAPVVVLRLAWLTLGGWFRAQPAMWETTT